MSRISNGLVSVTQPARVTSAREQSQSAESRDRWFWRIHLNPHKSIVEPLKYEGRRRNSPAAARAAPAPVGANGVAALGGFNAAPARLCHLENAERHVGHIFFFIFMAK